MTPLIPTNIDIFDLPLIDHAALPGLPASMEGRLFHAKGMEPCVVLFHPQAELHLLIRLTDLENLEHYVNQLNVAVLKQAMGETPGEEGYLV
jgi:hypothetical protein